MNRITFAFVVVLASGCATSPPRVERPPGGAPQAEAAIVSDRMPAETEKAASFTSLENSYFGVTNEVKNKAAAVAVGLMFGPLGVAANIAHNHSINRELVAPLSTLTSINLAKVLREELGPPKTSGGDSRYEVVPAAAVTFKTEDTYWLTCNIAVTGNGAPLWKGRYVVPVDDTFKSSNGQDTARAGAALGKCLRDAYTLFQDHAADRVGAFETKTIVARDLDGSRVERTAGVATAYLPARVVIKDYLGLTQVRQSAIVEVK